MNNKTYIGIDIGKHGAFAAIKHTGEIICEPMPLISKELDYPEILNILDRFSLPDHNVHVVFEKLGVIYRSAKSTAFSMGEQIGAIEMACVAKNIPYTKARAVDWQKMMFQGVTEMTRTDEKRDTKAMALLAVKRLFPQQKLTFTPRALKAHDGLVDALLMAEYARRRNL